MDENGHQKVTIHDFYNFGVFIQPDNSVAISEKLPEGRSEDDLMVTKFDSLHSAIKYLENSLEQDLDDFCMIWEDLEEIIDNIKLKPKKHEISDKLFHAFINSLVDTASSYKELQELSDKISIIFDQRLGVDDNVRSIISYYSTILETADRQLSDDYGRLVDLRKINEVHKIAKTKTNIKTAYYGGDGLGGRGRNTWTPFSGFDYADDRVMDGREIGEGKGHATQKFKSTNRFKRHPELNRWKTFGRYRTKPLRYKNYYDKKIKNKKKKNKKDVSLKTNGLVYTELTHDPAYIYWVDQQRNNPFGWKNRRTDSNYPSWNHYGNGFMSE